MHGGLAEGAGDSGARPSDGRTPPASAIEQTALRRATHRFSLEERRKGYDMVKHKEDGCPRAVFMP